jgi:hypothetical protein
MAGLTDRRFDQAAHRAGRPLWRCSQTPPGCTANWSLWPGTYYYVHGAVVALLPVLLLAAAPAYVYGQKVGHQLVFVNSV